MKLLSTVVFVIVATISFSQLGISTNYRQDGTWNEAGEKWDISSTDDSGTLLEFDKELTMFKHTTAIITSNYYITKWDYNDEDAKYTMTVTSDAGNEYELIIDGVNNCVAFFYWRGDTYYLVRHTIKDSWFNE